MTLRRRWRRRPGTSPSLRASSSGLEAALSTSPRAESGAKRAGGSFHPAIKVLAYERIVAKMRVPGQHAVDGFRLAWTEIFVWIETPAAGEQSLTAEDLV